MNYNSRVMDKIMINLSDNCQRTVCLNKVAKGRLGNRGAFYGLFVVVALTSFDWGASHNRPRSRPSTDTGVVKKQCTLTQSQNTYSRVLYASVTFNTISASQVQCPCERINDHGEWERVIKRWWQRQNSAGLV